MPKKCVKYGFFRTEEKAKKFISTKKRQDLLCKKYKDITFNYFVVKRTRNKSGLKTWLAYRLIDKLPTK